MFGHVVTMCVAVSEYDNFGACWGCWSKSKIRSSCLCEAWSDNHSKSPTPCFLCQLLGFIPIYYLLLALMLDIKSKRVQIRVVREVVVWPDEGEGLQIWL